MTSKCGKNKEVAHEPAAGECVFDVFTTLWRLLWSIFWTELDPRQHIMYLLHNDLKLRNYMISGAQKRKSLVAMTHDGNCCGGFLEFRHSQVDKNFFCLRFSIFLLCKFPGFQLLNLKQSYKCFQNRAPCWTKQRKQVSRDVIHVSLLQYSKTSWATTNHSARSIQITV